MNLLGTERNGNRGRHIIAQMGQEKRYCGPERADVQMFMVTARQHIAQMGQEQRYWGPERAVVQMCVETDRRRCKCMLSQIHKLAQTQRPTTVWGQ